LLRSLSALAKIPTTRLGTVEYGIQFDAGRRYARENLALQCDIDFRKDAGAFAMNSAVNLVQLQFGSLRITEGGLAGCNRFGRT